MVQYSNRYTCLSGPLLVILLCGGVMGAAGMAEATLTITAPSNNSTFPPGTPITFTASCALCYSYTWEFWNIADPAITDGGSGYTLQKAFTTPGQYTAKVTAIDQMYDPYLGYYPVTVVASVTFTIRSDEYTITITPHDGGAVSGPQGTDDGITECRPADAGTSRCVETYGKLTDKLQGSQFQVELDEGWQLLGWNVNGTFQTTPMLKSHENVTLEPLFGQVTFVSFWETNNPANKICDPTLLDERPAMPSNMLYLVESPVDEQYHVTLHVDTPTMENLMYAAFAPLGKNPAAQQWIKVPGSDGVFPATGVADMVFDHYVAPWAQSNILDNFTIRVGYDFNTNGLLDESEIMKLSVGAFRLAGEPLEDLAATLAAQGVFDDLAATSDKTAQELCDDFVKTLQENVFETQAQLLEAVTRCIGDSAAAAYQTQILEAADASSEGVLDEPTVRGTSAEGYQQAQDYIDFAVRWGFTIPNATSSFLQIFRDGKETEVSPERRPVNLGTIAFDCFAEDREDSVGRFSSWLPHNSGAAFTPTGTVELPYYRWGTSSSIAQKLGTYYQTVMAGRNFYFNDENIASDISTYFENKEVGSSFTFPSVNQYYNVFHRHDSPQWVPQTTVDFDDPLPNPLFVFLDDVLASVGRGRLLEHKARYSVTKVSENSFLVTQVNYTGVVEDLYDFNREAGGAGWRGATIQLGHSNGTYGLARETGNIFRARIEFDVEIEFPFDQFP